MSIREVLTFTKGSKKQCSWAYDILDEAFANLDNMENYIRKLDSYDAGHGEKLAGYTYAQVDEVRRFLNCCCESEQFKNAEHVINMGGQLDFDTPLADRPLAAEYSYPPSRPAAQKPAGCPAPARAARSFLRQEDKYSPR